MKKTKKTSSFSLNNRKNKNKTKKINLLITLFSCLIFLLFFSPILTQPLESVGDQDVIFPFKDFYDTQDTTSNDFEKKYIRVYYFFEELGYSFTDFDLNSPENTVQGETYFFSKWNKEDIIEKGIWGGLGFGSKYMLNSDFIIFTYRGNDEWTFLDGYTDKDNPHLMKIDEKRNDVKVIKKAWFTNIDKEKFYSYTNMFYFKWQKEIGFIDTNDWIGWPNWKTLNSPTICAFGFLKDKIKLEFQRHEIRSKMNTTILKNNSNKPVFQANQPLEYSVSPTGDIYYSSNYNWLMPFYSICEILDFDFQRGKQLYYRFDDTKTIMMIDFRVSKKKVRGSTYVLTELKHADIKPYGVYSGIVFHSQVENSYSLLFRYSIGIGLNTFLMKDYWIDSKGDLNFQEDYEDAEISKKYEFDFLYHQYGIMTENVSNVNNGGLNASDENKDKKTNNENNALKLINSAWFEINEETKKERFGNYNSLWASFWEIDLDKHEGFDIRGYLENPDHVTLAVFNKNNQEKVPIFIDNENSNGEIKVSDGQGISSINLSEEIIKLCHSKSYNFQINFYLSVLMIMIIIII